MDSHRHITRCLIVLTLALLILLGGLRTSFAGMPAPLPMWTVETYPDNPNTTSTRQAETILQAISFFSVVLLVSAAGVRFLWNVLRRDLSWLPELGYGRALSLTALWGLLFVIVLTMISGARELMTPGAWQQQGWTYQLNGQQQDSDARAARHESLESIRFALWQHAAQNDGRFPELLSDVLPEQARQIPGWKGLEFLYIPGQAADNSGRVLVYEPGIEADERLVLLTNGMIGSMPHAELQAAIEASSDDSSEVSP